MAQFRGGPQEGQFSPTKVKKAGLWIIIGLIAFVSLIGLAIYATYCRAAGRPLVTLPSSDNHQSRQGRLELDTTWRGGIIVDGQNRIDFKLLTGNVFWQVRVDGDDAKTYTMYPKNWQEKSHLEIAKGNSIEWRIKPGQETEKGLLVYSVHPKSDGPCF